MAKMKELTRIVNGLSWPERRGGMKLIRQGLKKLREEGWCQRTFIDHDGAERRYCAWGAVGVNPNGSFKQESPDLKAARALLMAGIKKVSPKASVAIPKRYEWPSGRLVSTGAVDGASIYNWNDTRGRKRGEVLRAFRHALKIGQRGTVEE